MVLTDARWAVPSPPIDRCRPRGKTEHHDLRAAPSRRSPRGTGTGDVAQHPGRVGAMVGSGHCHERRRLAAQTFDRWAHLGVWERLLESAQERGVAPGMGWRQASSPRRHQHPRAPEGEQGGPKGDRRRSGTRARRSAARVAATTPGPS
jgi:hypothetical protein